MDNFYSSASRPRGGSFLWSNTSPASTVINNEFFVVNASVSVSLVSISFTIPSVVAIGEASVEVAVSAIPIVFELKPVSAVIGASVSVGVLSLSYQVKRVRVFDLSSLRKINFTSTLTQSVNGIGKTYNSLAFASDFTNELQASGSTTNLISTTSELSNILTINSPLR